MLGGDLERGAELVLRALAHLLDGLLPAELDELAIGGLRAEVEDGRAVFEHHGAHDVDIGRLLGEVFQVHRALQRRAQQHAHRRGVAGLPGQAQRAVEQLEQARVVEQKVLPPRVPRLRAQARQVLAQELDQAGEHFFGRVHLFNPFQIVYTGL